MAPASKVLASEGVVSKVLASEGVASMALASMVLVCLLHQTRERRFAEAACGVG